MKIINIKKCLLASLACVFINACDTVDFEDTNVSPNDPTANLTNALLTEVEYQLGLTTTDVSPSLYIQHLAEVQFTNASRYGTTQFDYSDLYTQPIINLERIISLNTDPATTDEVIAYGSNNNQIAVASILKAFFYNHLTDRWGNIPFTQATNLVEFPTPAFDTQETIYTALFDLIDNALSIMDSGNGPTGDIMFGGDMDRWKQFANTLKLVMAQRLSDVAPALAQTKFTEAIAGGVISNVSENILFTFGEDDLVANAWENRYNGNRAPDYAVSDVFIDFLQDIERNDPRLSKYADPIGNDDTNSIYVGMEYALTAPSTDRGTVSFITETIANDPTAPGILFTYAQVSFAMAEAALDGWISGDAETLYYQGIKASMDQWGISSADYDTYITEPKVVYDANNAMNLIAEQKWAALYMQPYEAWAEWRRLDAPSLTPALEPLSTPTSSSVSTIPVREGYDNIIQSTNSANLDNAVSNQGLPGPFDNYTKLWWDVN